MTPAETLGKLIKLNPRKAYGPDGIPPWLLKENADLFSGPVTDILNCSYQECHLPPSWKKVDVVAIPKEKLIQDINNHLRPISLKPILSKLGGVCCGPFLETCCFGEDRPNTIWDCT